MASRAPECRGASLRLAAATIVASVATLASPGASAHRRPHARSADEEVDVDATVESDAPALRAEASPPSRLRPNTLELEAGVRAVHRTFVFNDPLSDHVAGVARPYSFDLPVAPAPFVDVVIYPLALTDAGWARHLGLVGRYERLMAATASVSGQSGDATIFSQDLEVGLRARVPVAPHEIGMTVTYGRQAFHVGDVTVGGTTGAGVPNVDYSYVRLGPDATLNLTPVSIGVALGTRLVTDTGELGRAWFPSTSTISIEGHLQIAFAITRAVKIFAGADYVRYAFDFHDPPATRPIAAGGAVDQYVDVSLGLRVDGHASAGE